MKKVYISSTYKDLHDYRKATALALRKIRCDVIQMEEYVARDQHTRAGCEDDVAGCDIYVGIFAWRYGYIPKDNNKDRQSITELEYRKAVQERKPRLLFLLADAARWSPDLMDSHTGEGDKGERIRKLRDELKAYSPSYFKKPDELATEVIAAVHQHLSTREVRPLSVEKEIKEVPQLGPSYLPNIHEKIVQAGSTEMVELSLRPTPWWTTRLHFVASLADNFTKIRQFVFLDADRRYLAMAPPTEIRRALARRIPKLERAYSDCLPPAIVGGTVPPEVIDQIVNQYSLQMSMAFPGQTEQAIKEDVTAKMLLRDLGLESSATAVKKIKSQALQILDILRCQTPFVVLVDNGKLLSVIDRVAMASDIAVQKLEEGLQ